MNIPKKIQAITAMGFISMISSFSEPSTNQYMPSNSTNPISTNYTANTPYTSSNPHTDIDTTPSTKYGNTNATSIGTTNNVLPIPDSKQGVTNISDILQTNIPTLYTLENRIAENYTDRLKPTPEAFKLKLRDNVPNLIGLITICAVVAYKRFRN